MLRIIFIIGMLFVMTSCVQVRDLVDMYPQDNKIEEVVEEIIKEKTGADVDLTPFSPEGNVL